MKKIIKQKEHLKNLEKIQSIIAPHLCNAYADVIEVFPEIGIGKFVDAVFEENIRLWIGTITDKNYKGE